MRDELAALFQRQDGVATAEQILAVVSRRHLEMLLEYTAVERIWRGVYCWGAADTARKLKGLDLACGETVGICLATAAGAYGFDTEGAAELHVLNPVGHQLRPVEGLVVHRRDGAPMVMVSGRPATAPAWTAVEVARTLRRPRALATLDAALRRDREKLAALQDLGWMVVPIVVDDVRRAPRMLVNRINAHLLARECA